MSFYNTLEFFRDFEFKNFHNSVTETDVRRVIGKDRLNQEDFLVLLSPVASGYLEIMAQKAHALTLRHFGQAVVLYTPMYLANYCVNRCLYCGYNAGNKIQRKKMDFNEVEIEAITIAKSGLRHILLLTGESRHHSPVAYIGDCVRVVARHFPCISIEVYPMNDEEYREIVQAGANGLTVYQETYNEEAYLDLHPSGPKRNFRYRLDAPERGCRAGMRTVNIGALLGLDDWRYDFFMTGLHADYLQTNYPEVEIAVSLPRMRPHAGCFQPKTVVSDHDLVQMILALRLFLPRGGISISTRESAGMRDNLLPLGMTRMSAGSSTEVGGHTLGQQDKGEAQFEVNDDRSVEEIKNMLYRKGYQPVFKDWDDSFDKLI